MAGIFIEITKPDADELWLIHIRLLDDQPLAETPNQEALQVGLQAVPFEGFLQSNALFGWVDPMDHADQVASGCRDASGQQVMGVNLFFSFASHLFSRKRSSDFRQPEVRQDTSVDYHQLIYPPTGSIIHSPKYFILKEFKLQFTISRVLTADNLGRNSGLGMTDSPDKRKKQLFILQGLPGVGLERAGRLLDTFGSVEAVVSASSNALQSVSGIGKGLADKIKSAVSEQMQPYGAVDQ